MYNSPLRKQTPLWQTKDVCMSPDGMHDSPLPTGNLVAHVLATLIQCAVAAGLGEPFVWGIYSEKQLMQIDTVI